MNALRHQLLSIRGALASFDDLDPNAGMITKQLLAAKLTAQIIRNDIDKLIADERNGRIIASPDLNADIEVVTAGEHLRGGV